MAKTYEYSTLEKKYNDLKRDFDYQNTIIKELMDKYSSDGKLKNLGICIELYYKVQQKTFTMEEIIQVLDKYTNRVGIIYGDFETVVKEFEQKEAE